MRELRVGDRVRVWGALFRTDGNGAYAARELSMGIIRRLSESSDKGDATQVEIEGHRYYVHARQCELIEGVMTNQEITIEEALERVDWLVHFWPDEQVSKMEEITNSAEARLILENAALRAEMERLKAEYRRQAVINDGSAFQRRLSVVWAADLKLHRFVPHHTNNTGGWMVYDRKLNRCLTDSEVSAKTENELREKMGD